MVTVDKAIIARLKTHGKNFEILVDCDKAVSFREGNDIDIKEILAVQKIFSDANKGMEASETEMNQIFSTVNVEEISAKIIKTGEIQLTTEYRERLRDKKRKKVIDYIHRNAVDPATHAPHPPQRIENAFLEAKIHIDEFRHVKELVNEALEKLKPIIPIKFEVKEIAVKFPAEFGAKAYPAVTKFGKLLRDEWLKDGSWAAVVEIPGGLEEEFYDKINKLTQGNVEAKVLNIR